MPRDPRVGTLEGQSGVCQGPHLIPHHQAALRPAEQAAGAAPAIPWAGSACSSMSTRGPEALKPDPPGASLHVPG